MLLDERMVDARSFRSALRDDTGGVSRVRRTDAGRCLLWDWIKAISVSNSSPTGSSRDELSIRLI